MNPETGILSEDKPQNEAMEADVMEADVMEADVMEAEPIKAEAVDYASVLGAPLTLPNGRTLKNRFFKSAMSEVLASVNHDATSGHARLYRQWAEGGSGVVVTGNVMVDRRALGEPRNVVFDEFSDKAAIADWARAATSNDTECWVQLNHPGKQSPKGLGDEPVAPSAVPLKGAVEKFFNPPRELTEHQILQLIQRFATAAGMAKAAGFTGVQIHGAHGYLVSQFFSPHHNQRQDRWGGSIENRMRFAREIYLAIRETVGPDFPVGIKLNSADFQRGGFTEEESTQVIRALDQLGMDLFEVSGGNYESPAMMGVSQRTRAREAYFIEFAAKTRKLIKAPIVVTGGFRTAKGMANAVASGETDLVGMARPMAITPDLPNQILAGTLLEGTAKSVSTGIKAIDRTAMLELSWYEQQMARLARGKPTRPEMNAYWSLLNALVSNGVQIFQKRRA